MKTNWSKFLSHVSSALSEANGTGSISRYMLFIFTVCWCTWGYMIITKNPEHISEYLTQTVILITSCLTAKVTKDITTKDTSAQSVPPSSNTKPIE